MREKYEYNPVVLEMQKKANERALELQRESEEDFSYTEALNKAYEEMGIETPKNKNYTEKMKDIQIKGKILTLKAEAGAISRFYKESINIKNYFPNNLDFSSAVLNVLQIALELHESNIDTVLKEV